MRKEVGEVRERKRGDEVVLEPGWGGKGRHGLSEFYLGPSGEDEQGGSDSWNWWPLEKKGGGEKVE